MIEPYTLRPLLDLNVQRLAEGCSSGVKGKGRERETTGYEPFALRAPIQWAI